MSPHSPLLLAVGGRPVLATFGYNSDMLNVEGVIVPGKAAGGVSIGSPVSEFLSLNRPQSTKQLPDDEQPDSGVIRIWAKKGIVTQIGVYSGYRGKLQSAIPIGSTIADVEDYFGCPIEEDEEDNLIVPNSRGGSRPKRGATQKLRPTIVTHAL